LPGIQQRYAAENSSATCRSIVLSAVH